MPEETLDLIRELKLTEDTDDEALQSARDLALKYVRSRSPIPQTVMTVVERGAKMPTEMRTHDSNYAIRNNQSDHATHENQEKYYAPFAR